MGENIWKHNFPVIDSMNYPKIYVNMYNVHPKYLVRSTIIFEYYTDLCSSLFRAVVIYPIFAGEERVCKYYIK